MEHRDLCAQTAKKLPCGKRRRNRNGGIAGL